MKVVHVIVGLEVGGAELMLQRLLLTQRAQGAMAATVIALTRLGPVGQRLRDRGIEVIALGMRTPLGAPRAVWRLRGLLQRLHPDVVQTWMVHADLLGGLAARAAGLRAVIWGIRTTDFSINPLATRAVRWLCARLSSTLPHVIVCAAEASRRAHVQAGYDASRMLVIPNGFDASAWQPQPGLGEPLRREFGLAPGDLVVGCVGRFNVAKDQGNFIAAAAHVAAQRTDCRFVLVGRGMERGNAELMQWIEATGHAARFVLLGERTDVAACMAAMDIFVLPSRSEGFPNALGEAMAMALPCVATDVGDAAVLLAETGRIVPPRNPAALADAVLALATLPPTQRHQLGQAARERVLERFSLQQTCERFTALQRQVAAEAGRRTREAVA
ncbi:MAG: glycosyltransferase [Rubrivivax sp.]|nr:glycosyltransferase [Rubrivivax sp.]